MSFRWRIMAACVVFAGACTSAELPSPPTTSQQTTTTNTAQGSARQTSLLASDAMPDDNSRDKAAEQRLVDGLELGSPRSDEEAQAWLRHEQAIMGQQDEFVLGCMAKEGFEYFYDPPEQRLQLSGGFEHPYGSAEWADRYGVGASTLLFTQDEVGPDLVGSPEPEIRISGDDMNDPADLYLESLGETGQAAYWVALYGHAPGEYATSEAEYLASKPDRDRSCSGQAELAHPFQYRLVELEWDEAEIRELRDRVAVSDEVQDMLRLGALCVQAEGFTSTSRSTALDEMGEQMQVLFRIEPHGLSNPEFVEMLASIQDYELELVAALTRCGVGAQLEAPTREAVAIRLAYEMKVILPKVDG